MASGISSAGGWRGTSPPSAAITLFSVVPEVEKLGKTMLQPPTLTTHRYEAHANHSAPTFMIGVGEANPVMNLFDRPRKPFRMAAVLIKP